MERRYIMGAPLFPDYDINRMNELLYAINIDEENKRNHSENRQFSPNYIGLDAYHGIVSNDLELIESVYNYNDYDVPDYMLHTDRQNAGFFFGTNESNSQQGTKSYVGKPEKCDGHILVVGGSGSGKSSCIAIPTLETWKGSIFAIDIKGELKKHWDGIKTEKRPIKIFSLAKGDEGSFGYDPYYFLRQDDENNLINNVREIVLTIIPMPSEIKDSFWIKAAQNVLTAMILFGLNYYEVDFSTTMLMIQTTPIKDLCDDIFESDYEIPKLFINNICELKEETLAGIAMEISNHVMVFATDPIIRNSIIDSRKDEKDQESIDCFTWEDLEENNIFMCIPEDKLEQWDSMITLMLTQLIRTLERRQERGSKEGMELPPVLLLLDEFPRLGKVNVIKSAMATLRSKGVTICLIIQSLAQLKEIYGELEQQTILDNCRYRVVLNATDLNSQKYFSELIGTEEKLKLGYNVNVNPDTGQPISHGQTLNPSREFIINPNELAMLKDTIVLLTEKGLCYVAKSPYYRK